MTRYGIQIPIRREARIAGFVWTLEVDLWHTLYDDGMSVAEGGTVSWTAPSSEGSEFLVAHDDRSGLFSLVGIHGSGCVLHEVELGLDFESPLDAMRRARKYENGYLEAEQRISDYLEENSRSFLEWLEEGDLSR